MHAVFDISFFSLYVVYGCSAKETDHRGHVVSLQGQRGILSCFAAHPTSPSVVAAGAFNGDGEFEVASRCTTSAAVSLFVVALFCRLM